MMLSDGNDHRFSAPADVYRAEGALIERFGLDVDAAAGMLEREAALRAITVSDVAREVLTGERPLCGSVLDPWGSC
jgi:hypothetical protein